MNCIIIEDQPPAQRILKKYIADVDSLVLKGTFSNAIEAMEFLNSGDVELLFLDIHLPRMSGIDFIKSLVNPPHVILTTAFPDYALEGYELNVVDYLLKPFSFQRFLTAVSKVPQKKIVKEGAHMEKEGYPKEMFVKSGYELIKIHVSDILFIKSDADYTEIHLAQARHLSSEPLRFWEEKLDAQKFARIHKSYIVHLSKIQKISGSKIYLPTDKTVPIGRVYKEDFINRINKI